MDAVKLRIGNFVLIENDLLPNLKNEPVVVTGIQSRTEKEFPLSNYVISVQVDKHNGVSQFNEFIKPVPLTEEWLVKFGFEKNESSAQFMVEYSDFGVRISEESFSKWESGFYHFGEYHLLAEIEFVYQLQNLYFALTGKELKCK